MRLLYLCPSGRFPLNVLYFGISVSYFGFTSSFWPSVLMSSTTSSNSVGRTSTWPTQRHGRHRHDQQLWTNSYLRSPPHTGHLTDVSVPSIQNQVWVSHTLQECPGGKREPVSRSLLGDTSVSRFAGRGPIRLICLRLAVWTSCPLEVCSLLIGHFLEACWRAAACELCSKGLGK